MQRAASLSFTKWGTKRRKTGHISKKLPGLPYQSCIEKSLIPAKHNTIDIMHLSTLFTALAFVPMLILGKWYRGYHHYVTLDPCISHVIFGNSETFWPNSYYLEGKSSSRTGRETFHPYHSPQKGFQNRDKYLSYNAFSFQIMRALLPATSLGQYWNISGFAWRGTPFSSFIKGKNQKL